MSENIEETFTKAQIKAQIDAKLADASKAIEEACDLADKHKISFYGITNCAEDEYDPKKGGWQTSYC